MSLGLEERGDEDRGAAKPHSRLLRKYALIFAGLIAAALITSGLIELYFSFQDNKAALLEIQREKAKAAATSIQSFVIEVAGQISWTTSSTLAPSAESLAQRRIDYLKLLRQAPAVSEISYLDPAGFEQILLSRVAMDVLGSGTDYSADVKFREARAEGRYFGPVYFRKDSQPYMTFGLAGRGRDKGVTTAEVNLRFIWDVVSRIRVGQAGQAYVVDAQGLLIAHPDISLVLRKTDLSALPQVVAARAGLVSQGDGIARGLAEEPVLTAHAAIASLGWVVFVESPLKEAFAPLYASLTRTIVLLVVGIAASVLVGLLVTRRLVGPIRALQQGAARIGGGDFDHRIKIRTGDELEDLADHFNHMGARIKASYADLEHRIDERTRELSDALTQQVAASEVLRAIADSPANVGSALQAVARNVTRLCDATNVAIYHGDGDVLRTAASYATVATTALQENFTLPVDRTSVSGRAVMEKQTVHVHDLCVAAAEYPDFPFRTRGEHDVIRASLATPLMRERNAIGAIAAFRTQTGAFTDKQIEIVEGFADHAVIAIENARLLDELHVRSRELARSVEELKALGAIGHAVSSSLELQKVLDAIVANAVGLSAGEGGVIYAYDEDRKIFLPRATHRLPQKMIDDLTNTPVHLGVGVVGRAADRREVVQIEDIEGVPDYTYRGLLAEGGYRAIVGVPLLREERVIGGLVVLRRTAGRFGPETIELLETFASQSALAMQNARLYETIGQKNRENEQLLLNILPGPVAERLKSGQRTIADTFPQASVLFADVVDFTSIAAELDPEEILVRLNKLFSEFDALAKQHGVEKIKTIGDCYMAVAGVPEPINDHASAAAELALGMLEAARQVSTDGAASPKLRIGIDTGPVVAGVIGTSKFTYDLWGDTVNLASRMESTGVPGAIQVTDAVQAALSDRYTFEPRGEIEVKGKGLMHTYLLTGRRV